MYAKIETERLQYLRREQSALRANNYKELHGAIVARDGYPRNVGQKVVLQVTFTGGLRYMYERQTGCDDIFANLRPTGPIHHNDDKP